MTDIDDILNKVKRGCVSVRAVIALIFGGLFMVSTLHKNLKVYNYGLVMGCMLWGVTITINKDSDEFGEILTVKGLGWVVAEKENPPPPLDPKPAPKPDPEKPGRPTSSSSNKKSHVLSIENNQGDFNV